MLSAGLAKPGGKVRLRTLTREVAGLVEAVGIKVGEDRTPPTLHEVSSLAARLWSEQYGTQFAQALLGHRSADMTVIYRDVRDSDRITVKAGA